MLDQRRWSRRCINVIQMFGVCLVGVAAQGKSWGASVTEKYRAWPQTARVRISNPVSVLSDSSQHPQEVLLAHLSLYVHRVGLKPH